MIQRELAIVLRSVATGERDRVVTALTETGGLRAGLARNSIQSRRFGGALEMFTAAEWSFVARPGQELVSLREATVRRAFEGVRKDLNRLGLAGAFSEILLKLLQPGESAPELFKLHSNALAHLEEDGASVALLIVYVTKVLSWSGHQPRWLHCLACEKPLSDLWREHQTRTEGTASADTAEATWLACRIPEAGWLCPECRLSAGSAQQAHVGLTGSHISLHAAAEAGAKLHLPIRQAVREFALGLPEQRELLEFVRSLLLFHVPGFDRQPLRSLEFVQI